jgi:hypothetical protein
MNHKFDTISSSEACCKNKLWKITVHSLDIRHCSLTLEQPPNAFKNRKWISLTLQEQEADCVLHVFTEGFIAHFMRISEQRYRHVEGESNASIGCILQALKGNRPGLHDSDVMSWVWFE